MNIEYILREYPHIPETIQKLNNELNGIIQCKDDTYCTLKAQRLTGMPHGTGTSDVVYESVEKIIDRYGERISTITDDIHYWLDAQEFINNAYYMDNLLTFEERKIIDFVYFKSYKMKRMPYIMHYSLPHCYRINDSAIKKLSELENMRKNEKKIC